MRRSPFALAVVWLLATVLALVEAAFLLGGAGVIGGPEAAAWRLEAMQRLGVAPAMTDWMLENRSLPPDLLGRFLGYALVHEAPLRALFVVVLVAGLGRALAARMGGGAILAIFVLGAAGGALGYTLAGLDAQLLTGGLPAVFALLGAFATLLVTGQVPAGLIRVRALALIALAVALRVALGIWVEDGARWSADIAGFVTGGLLAAVLRPGGWRALRGRVRHE